VCLFPWTATLDPEGGRPTPDPEGSLKLPCGKCDECISLRAFHWGTRARHEISMHQDNCFLTLTYDDDNLPSELIVKKPFQDFMKRLRQKSKKKLLYMVSHEYGTKLLRPHHHCIIFGWEPPNQEYLKMTKSGHPLFTSPELSDLWPHGHHSIGEANEKTAYYIASYALKGRQHELVAQGGEIHQVHDQFDCSKRPGIGLEYLKKNYKQMINSGDPLPRYYQKKLKDIDEDYLQIYEDRAAEKIKDRSIHERYSKFKISTQKKKLGDNEWRSAPQNSDSSKIEKRLKSDVYLYKENL